jgi:hypothetical protein
MAETMDAASIESGVIRIEWAGAGRGDGVVVLIHKVPRLGGSRVRGVWQRLRGVMRRFGCSRSSFCEILHVSRGYPYEGNLIRFLEQTLQWADHPVRSIR